MAESRGVWGIDIGQAGLKALRLRYADAAGQAIAVAFDYVPHPKLLSQPDAVPDELIPQALEKFLSRNDVKGDLIAISVPGQSALSRFIQLPPVEAGKVADIVKYEARQQIPFALEDVIWDYQTISGGIEESGYMLGAEVGLFAMKKEQVHHALKPFLDAKVEVEIVQIAPLALYNVLVYDQLGVRLDSEEKGQDSYTIALDMGADNTTLLVSNGEKIWIRNVPIGGNHFTRALTKEMKLTFAKAEHLKCNAVKSPDPPAVFQAMRPVFHDYVSEIQRSIGYFSSVNREAKISKIVGYGNGFKLAGLQKFVQQNLQYEVERGDHFNGLVGDAVLNAPLFEENILAFAVPYGLALQALKLTGIRTSLLPPEIATARKIRKKKPWAVTTAAAVLFGLATTAAGYATVRKSVSEDRFGAAEAAVSSVNSQIGSAKSAYDSEVGRNSGIIGKGKQLLEPLHHRDQWLEIYQSIAECLPRDVGDAKNIEDITQRNRIKILSIQMERKKDLAEWFNAFPPGSASKDYMAEIDRNTPPQGEGYLVTLQCVHYHHDPKDPTYGQNVGYALNTLVKNLQQWTITQPESSHQDVPVRLLGITHPTVTQSQKKLIPYQSETDDMSAMDMFSGEAAPAQPRTIDETEFTVQFCWRPVTERQRLIFDALHKYHENPENAAKGSAEEFVKQLTRMTPTPEDIAEYAKLHPPQPAPQPGG